MNNDYSVYVQKKHMVKNYIKNIYLYKDPFKARKRQSHPCCEAGGCRLKDSVSFSHMLSIKPKYQF